MPPSLTFWQITNNTKIIFKEPTKLMRDVSIIMNRGESE